MNRQLSSRTLAYSLILIGCLLALIASVVPHYTAGYRVMVSVLLVGILPYLIYGMAVPFLNGTLLVIPGIALTMLHTLLVIRERFLNHADYSDGFIYYGPLALAILMLPLVARALREPWGAEPEKSSAATQDQHPQAG